MNVFISMHVILHRRAQQQHGDGKNTRPDHSDDRLPKRRRLAHRGGMWRGGMSCLRFRPFLSNMCSNSQHTTHPERAGMLIVVITNIYSSVLSLSASPLRFSFTSNGDQSVLKQYLGYELSVPLPTAPQTPWALNLPSQPQLGTCL